MLLVLPLCCMRTNRLFLQGLISLSFLVPFFRSLSVCLSFPSFFALILMYHTHPRPTRHMREMTSRRERTSTRERTPTRERVDLFRLVSLRRSALSVYVPFQESFRFSSCNFVCCVVLVSPLACFFCVRTRYADIYIDFLCKFTIICFWSLCFTVCDRTTHISLA